MSFPVSCVNGLHEFPETRKGVWIVMVDHVIVGHSYMDCWEVVVNWPACIELLLLSGYCGRTFDSMRALFTEVWVAICKAMYLDENETQNVQFGCCLFLGQV